MIYSRFLAKTYHPKGCSTLVERTLQITPFFAKQTQFFPNFHLKMSIKMKNKAKTNPIQTQTNPIQNLSLYLRFYAI